MTALAPAYRVGETPLMTRERALEQELVATRYMLDALANEEARIGRCVRSRELPQYHLDALQDTLLMHLANEERLVHELEAVRAEIVARGERKRIAPQTGDDLGRFAVPASIAALVIAMLVGVMSGLAGANTARAAPAGVSLEWNGPLEPGLTWLYVEGPAGARFEVDGRPFHAPDTVPVSALHAHDVRFDGGPAVHVRWIPCTTAVVRWHATHREASVERFYNGSTCF